MYYRQRADIASKDLSNATNNANQSDESKEIFNDFQNEINKNSDNNSD